MHTKLNDVYCTINTDGEAGPGLVLYMRIERHHWGISTRDLFAWLHQGSLWFVLVWRNVIVWRPIHTGDELLDELTGRSHEFVHKLNQCTVPNRSVHTCFSIRPPICPGRTRKMVLWTNSHQIRLVIRALTLQINQNFTSSDLRTSHTLALSDKLAKDCCVFHVLLQKWQVKSTRYSTVKMKSSAG